MPAPHHRVWPPGVPHRLDLPAHSLFGNLDAAARRFPDRPALIYHGTTLSYAELLAEVEHLAGWLQQVAGVARGDRVLLYMQNSPHFVFGYYAIMRADAVCVPVNPMNRGAELDHIAEDTAARVALCGAELWPALRPLRESGALDHALVASYADMADPTDEVPLHPSVAGLAEPEDALTDSWRAALAAGHRPRPHEATAEDIALIPYSSGTTGRPKGCTHTHRSVNATAVGSVLWNPTRETDVHLAALPLCHVTGMTSSMNGPLLSGGAIVPLTRWDRQAAARLIERHRVTRWRSITTMVIDLVNDPEFERYDLSSLTALGGGGAAMPEAVARRLKQMTGLDYIEGYGLSETMAATHINPVHAPRAQCLGIPVMEVESRVISLEDGRELGPDETGEIVMAGPQVFQGYWNNPEATEAAFIELDGRRFFRSGDIGHYDADGYFYMTDRLKRMINVSGFKVWPAEVEAMMLDNPDLAEACIVASRDPRRGETVAAYVVPSRSAPDLTEERVKDWCRAHMAAYKCPARVVITDALPRSGTGKVLWRELAQREEEAATA
ncbi:AMP-binding protein [Aquicoccus sp. SCR17]|nr:AMP-binding protein [Carideicomes alvinocaridis]